MLSPFARNECLAVGLSAAMLTLAALAFGLPWVAPLPALLGLLILAFYRNPRRHPPVERHVLVSPADGKVVSVHEVAEFPALGGPAVCVRIFLSVFDVHVNYAPCHAITGPRFHRAGRHMSVLKPESAEVNEAITTVLLHPATGKPIAAVRQIAGQFARTVECALQEGQTVHRGMPFGIMKLGSTAEVYVPLELQPEVLVKVGQRVTGATSLLVRLPGRVMAEHVADEAPAAEVQAPAAAHDTAPEAAPVSPTIHPSEPMVLMVAPAPQPEPPAPASAAAPVTIAIAAAPAAEEPLGTFSSRLLTEPGDQGLDTATGTSPLSTSGMWAVEQAASHAGVPVAPPPEESTMGLESSGLEAAEDAPPAAEAPASSPEEEDTGLAEHAVQQVMAGDAQAADSLPGDGEHLSSRMEIAGTDLMLHPKDEGRGENEALAGALSGLRPDAVNDVGDLAGRPAEAPPAASAAFMAWHEAETARPAADGGSPSVPQIEPLAGPKRRGKGEGKSEGKGADKNTESRGDKRGNPDALLWEEAE